MLTRRLAKMVMIGIAMSLIADVAWASIGPFSFTFFTPVLNNLVLLPFQIAGCLP